MIIDLPRFLAAERPSWVELEGMLDQLRADPCRRLSLAQAQRFFLLYQKVSADLGRVATFASEPELRSYLESLTARAYSEIHETRTRRTTFRPLHWFAHEFPRVFRKHTGAFVLSLLITLAGAVFGGLATALDENAKEAIVPAQFAHLLGDPAKRVAAEESATHHEASAYRSQFASALMTNNIRVSIFTLALGVTFGIGTMIELFYTGVVLGLVCVDYVFAGQTLFLLGWLMPHGVIEIPAILIAGQGGLILGRALIARGERTSVADVLRAIGGDLMTLIGGVTVLLVWAGIVESFLSQFHEPAIRYWQKIVFGLAEFAALLWFLRFKGIEEKPPRP